MRRRIDIAAADIIPSTRAILSAQGIPGEVEPDARLCDLAEKAAIRCGQLAEPVGLLAELTTEQFASVYTGEGENEESTPLEQVYRKTDHLSLFAVTIGQDISTEIARLFEAHEYAAASMLDSAASEAAELAAQHVVSFYRAHLQRSGRFPPGSAAMEFSPGYCGWHVSGQRKLFDRLQPGEIGILLSESFLMHPLKSISGVIAVGPKDIFDFDPCYSFCEDCETRSCRERMRALSEL